MNKEKRQISVLLIPFWGQSTDDRMIPLERSVSQDRPGSPLGRVKSTVKKGHIQRDGYYVLNRNEVPTMGLLPDT